VVQRLYQEEGLALKHRPKRHRRASEQRGERMLPAAANQAWSLDFVADQLMDGRRFRALTIMDVFTRESLAIEVEQALKGTDVVEVLNPFRFQRSAPKVLFLRQWIRVHQSDHGAVGLSERSANGVFPTRETHR